MTVYGETRVSTFQFDCLHDTRKLYGTATTNTYRWAYFDVRRKVSRVPRRQHTPSSPVHLGAGIHSLFLSGFNLLAYSCKRYCPCLRPIKCAYYRRDMASWILTQSTGFMSHVMRHCEGPQTAYSHYREREDEYIRSSNGEYHLTSHWVDSNQTLTYLPLSTECLASQAATV